MCIIFDYFIEFLHHFLFWKKSFLLVLKFLVRFIVKGPNSPESEASVKGQGLIPSTSDVAVEQAFFGEVLSLIRLWLFYLTYFLSVLFKQESAINHTSGKFT